MNALEELRRLAAHAENRRTETGIPRVAMVKGRVPEHELTGVYEPMINVILQGSKTMTVGTRTVRFDPSSYFVLSLELPAIGTVHSASNGQPYLATSLTLEPHRIAEIIETSPVARVKNNGFAVAKMTPELLDAWVRMLRLINRPTEVATLAPLYECEILFRVLQGPQGHVLRDVALPDSAISRIRLSIASIRQNFLRPLRIARLARMAAMSESAFHRHFRLATALSPLQFQKRLRLMQARAWLIENRTNASTAAFEVGYESASQFSREYARFFGNPPAADAREARSHLRQVAS